MRLIDIRLKKMHQFEIISVYKPYIHTRCEYQIRKRIILKYATTHHHPQPSTSTWNHPQPLTTINNHPKPSTIIHNYPKNSLSYPKSPNIYPKKPKTCHKQLCYYTLDVNTEKDIDFDSDIKQWYICMCVCLDILYKSLYLLFFG